MLADEARHATGRPKRAFENALSKLFLANSSFFPYLDLEVYFSRCFGLSLLTLATITILLTGSIPLSSAVSTPVTTDEKDPKAPYAVPTLTLTSIFHAACAFYNYTWFAWNGQAAFGVGVFGSAVLASVGLWCILFASSHGRINRTTGADKRMTGFPFNNIEADKKRRKKSGVEGKRE